MARFQHVSVKIPHGAVYSYFKVWKDELGRDGTMGRASHPVPVLTARIDRMYWKKAVATRDQVGNL